MAGELGCLFQKVAFLQTQLSCVIVHLDMNYGSPASAEIEYELSAEGFRTTKLRSALLSIFADQIKPFSVDEITTALGKKKLSVHKVTLYRELAVLVKAEVISPIYFHDQIQRYEFVQHKHHHHVVCTSCGVIADVEIDDELEGQIPAIEKKTKFTLLRHSLEFFGLCKTCASKS